MLFSFKFILATFLACISISACNYCGKLDCIPNENLIRIRILRSTNNDDLVFGPNSIYNSQGIKFYSFNGMDTVYYPTSALAYPTQQHDSLINVQFYPNAQLVYLRLNNTDRDTLTLSFSQSRNKCCGNVIQLNQFNHNNTQLYPDMENIVVLKK